MRELLQVRNGKGLIADELFKEAMARATGKHDGVAVARALLRFLRE